MTLEVGDKLPAFKGETDKARESLAMIETQFSEEIDILDRARRFAAMNLTKDGTPQRAPEELRRTPPFRNHVVERF